MINSELSNPAKLSDKELIICFTSKMTKQKQIYKLLRTSTFGVQLKEVSTTKSCEKNPKKKSRKCRSEHSIFFDNLFHVDFIVQNDLQDHQSKFYLYLYPNNQAFASQKKKTVIFYKHFKAEYKENVFHIPEYSLTEFLESVHDITKYKEKKLFESKNTQNKESNQNQSSEIKILSFTNPFTYVSTQNLYVNYKSTNLKHCLKIKRECPSKIEYHKRDSQWVYLYSKQTDSVIKVRIYQN